MVEYNPRRSLLETIPDAPQTDGETNFGDYWRPAVGAVGDLGAQGRAISRYFNESIGDTTQAGIDAIKQQQNQEWADSVRGNMSDAGRAGLESSVLSPEFWQHPIRNSLMKTSAMAPAMVVGMLPGGIIADATAATVAAAGANAALNVGAFLNDIDKRIDGASDEDLAKQSDYYAGLRGRLDEKEARTKFKEYMASDKARLAMLAIVSGAAGVFTPGGVVARAGGKDLINEAERSALGHFAVHGAEGASAMAVQSGFASAIGQKAAIAGGFQKDFDMHDWWSQVAEGVGLGGALSGTTGALTGKRPAASDKKPTLEGKPGTTVQVAPEVGPDATQQAATAKGPKTEATGADEGALNFDAPPRETPPQEPPQNQQARDAIAALDATGKVRATEPEPQGQLNDQRQQLADGERKAVLYTPGEKIPPEIAGMKRIPTDAGIVDFNPSLIKPVEILRLVAERRENELLDLGPHNKAAVAESVGRGAEPVGVRTVSEEGAPIREAASTTELAKETAAHMEATRKGNEAGVEVVPEHQVLADRQARVAQEQSAPVQQDLLTAKVSTSAEPPKTRARRLPKGVPSEIREQAEGLRKALAGGNKGEILKAESAIRMALPIEEARTAVEALRAEAQKDAQKKTATPTTRPNVVAAVREFAAALKGGDEEARAKAENVIRKNLSANGADDVISAVTKAANGQALSAFDKAQLLQWLTNEKPTKTEQAIATSRAKAETPAQEAARLAQEQADERAKDKRNSITKAQADKTPASSFEDPVAIAERKALEGESNRGGLDVNKTELTTGPASKPRKVELTDEEKAKAAETSAKSDAKRRAERITEELKKAQEQADREAAQAAKDAAAEAAKEKRDASTLEAEMDRVREISDRGGLNMSNAQVRKQALKNIEARKAERAPKAQEEGGLFQAMEHVTEGETSKIAEGLMGDLFGRKPKAEEPKTETAPVEAPKGRQEGHELEQDLAGKTLHEAVAHVAETSNNASYRTLAERIGARLRELADAGMNFGFQVVKPGDMLPSAVVRSLNRAYGLADYNWSKASNHMNIYLNGHEMGQRSGMSHEILLHEAAHGAMMSALRLGETAPAGSELRANYAEAVDLFNRVIKHFNDKVKNNEPLSAFEQRIFDRNNNALRDMDELFAWGLTNKDMQAFLREIPGTHTSSLLGDFVQLMARLLGLKPNETNALVDMLHLSDKLLSTDVDAMKTHTESRGQALMQHSGDFTEQGNAQKQQSIDDMFKRPLKEALLRDTSAFVQTLKNPVTNVSDFISHAVNDPKGAVRDALANPDRGSMLHRIGMALTPNDQFRQANQAKLPMIRGALDAVEKAGVYANELKKPGMELAGALFRAQREVPGAFEKFQDLIHRQTMFGVDAASALGEGRNKHLELSAKAQAGDDASAAPMRAWEARNAHAGIKADYDALVKEHPEFAKLQEALFSYYDKTHEATTKGILDHILRSYGHEGTTAERAALVDHLYNNKLTDTEDGLSTFLGQNADAITKAKLIETLGTNAVAQIEGAQAFKKLEGPYAPLMRRGEHVVVGEYKLPEAAHAIARPELNIYEFATAKDAHDFAIESGLHFSVDKVYYDNETGEKTTKIGGINTTGAPEGRYAVTLQNKHVEFHETRAEAEASHKALHASGEFEKLGIGERQQMENMQQEFTPRGVLSLMKSLEQQAYYKTASETEKAQLRDTIKEAGIRAMSGNRIQSRRLPRRRVEGASNDVMRNLYDYTNSSSNYLGKLQFQEPIAAAMKAMWDHVNENRYGPDYTDLTRIANETERRVRAPDPAEFSGAYTDWTRRISTWSYIDRMMRPSHLILHQTHLPMITAPIVAGRHGLGDTYGMMIKVWKQATGAYSAGGKDFVNSIADAMHKGTDYGALFKESFKGEKDAARIGQMFDHLAELGWLHPEAGMEVQKYMPSTQKTGALGGMDRAIQKFDTVFRHLTNATEAINRYVGATMAYRLEFEKLTREGKNEAQAHEAAIDYARNTISNTQGVYSTTNAAPVFKNKWLRPFLQFRQFPNMIYNLLARTTVQAFKGDSKEARVQAAASVGLLLGTHTMMTGALGGLPMEAFKVAGMVSRGLGLTENDWNDVEKAVSDRVLSTLGHGLGETVLHGVGRFANVDVHHRMGLNSFFTFGMPDKLESTNLWAFVGKQVAGAPGGLAEDTFKGVHKMMTGDLSGGMLQAMPLQALRDVARAWEGGSKSTTGYQYQGAGDTAARLLGFTPANEAAFYEKKAQTYRALDRYNTERSELMRTWSTSKPERRDDVWSRIAKWNDGKPKDAQITKGDLIKSLNRRESSDRINGIPVNSHNRTIVESSASLN